MNRHLKWIEGRLPRIVAGMLAVAALLAIVMAIVAPINHQPELWRGPPDEHGHRGSAHYYVDHWLPPRVGDPATLPSYSLDYGFSYINDPDMVYFLAGKFAALLSPVVPNLDLGFRLFNAFLLVVLAALCFLHSRAWPVFVPLCVSPQIWYIFSYFNGDALPLFLSVIVAQQVVDPESRFNRFLDTPGLRGPWCGPLLLGLLLALLLLSKKNYYSFIALLPAALALVRFNKTSALLLGSMAVGGSAWYLHWTAQNTVVAGQQPASPAWAAVIAAIAAVAIFAAIVAQRSTRRERAVTLGKLALLGALAAAFVAPRFVWDARLHGSLDQKRVAIGNLQEQIAKPAYKPSTIYTRDTKTYHGIELRSRGTPLTALFDPPWQWHLRTFATATGVYGWLQFEATGGYFQAMLASYLGLLGVYAWAVVRARRPEAIVGFVLVAGFSALTVGVALFTSWVHDFQAQGRYLFPIVPMLGAGLFLVRDSIPRSAAALAITTCFLLGLYSFLFIGFRYVPGSF
jgi:hypothetical protein